MGCLPGAGGESVWNMLEVLAQRFQGLHATELYTSHDQRFCYAKIIVLDAKNPEVQPRWKVVLPPA